MYVWLIILMFVFVKDCHLYGLVTKRVFSYLDAVQLASSCKLDHVGGSVLSDGYIFSLECHHCACVCVWVCVRRLHWNQKHFSFSLLFTFWKHFRGVNTTAAGTSVQDCIQYVSMASKVGEVRECEIRWCFTEGDNELRAVFTRWALQREELLFLIVIVNILSFLSVRLVNHLSSTV